MIHSDRHPLAGQTVKLNLASAPAAGDAVGSFRVEDWWDRVGRGSWMFAQGNPACLMYAMRSGIAQLPTDDEVVYGKDERGLGHIVHVSELVVATEAAERTAFVIPADPDQACLTITWSGGELLSLYQAIGCDTVEAIALNIDGAGPTNRVTVWVDENGRRPGALVNSRFGRLASGLGQPYMIFGAVVITGDADDDGDTLGLDAELLAELQRVIA